MDLKTVPPLIEGLRAEISALEEQIAPRKEVVNVLCRLLGQPAPFQHVSLGISSPPPSSFSVPVSEHIFPAGLPRTAAEREGADGLLPDQRRRGPSRTKPRQPRTPAQGGWAKLREDLLAQLPDEFTTADIKRVSAQTDPGADYLAKKWTAAGVAGLVEKGRPKHPARYAKAHVSTRPEADAPQDLPTAPKPARARKARVEAKPAPAQIVAPPEPRLVAGRLAAIEGELVIDALRRALEHMPERFTKLDLLKVLPLALTSGVKEQLIGENIAELRRLGELKFSPWKRVDGLSEYMRGDAGKGVR